MSFIKFLMEQRYNEGPFGLEPESEDGENRLDKMDAAMTAMDDELGDEQEQLFHVPGIGMMKRDQAERRAAGKLADIAQRASQPNADWTAIQKLVNDSGLLAYIQALANNPNE